MVLPNENQTQPKPPQEFCSIRLMFPIDSDEEAIGIKKKIREAISDKPDIQIQFAIMSSPNRPPMG